LLDERQQRIDDALYNNVPVDTIRQYENTLANLKGITKEQLEDEGEEGIELRKQIMFADYINKGFSEKRAEKEVKKSFDSGNDIEDSGDSLESLINTHSKDYENILKDAKDKETNRIKSEKEQIEKVKTRFMDTEEPVKGLKLSKSDREKMYNQTMKIVAKDNDNKPVTELQKYAIENPVDYQYYINMLYYQTNGFKDLSKVVSKEVKTQNQTTMKNLEKVLKNQSMSVNSGSDLDFGNSTDENSFSKMGLNVKLD